MNLDDANFAHHLSDLCDETLKRRYAQIRWELRHRQITHDIPDFSTPFQTASVAPETDRTSA